MRGFVYLDKIKIYTFRTCPFSGELRGLFGDVFVFGKLKEDLEKFKLEIVNDKPDYILGIAHIPKFYKSSQFETSAINQFQRVKKVSREGIDKYNLFVPDLNNTNFRISKKNGDSFCNWTIYKISEFLSEEKLGCKFIFTHLKVEDINNLNGIITNLNRARN